jgi:hypothetical protein
MPVFACKIFPIKELRISYSFHRSYGCKARSPEISPGAFFLFCFKFSKRHEKLMGTFLEVGKLLLRIQLRDFPHLEGLDTKIQIKSGQKI